MSATSPRCIFHASTVAFNDKAVVIKGASGSGKSSLALQLIGLDAMLIADDRTELTRTRDGVIATCPNQIEGKVEARSVGILNAPFQICARVHLIVDLDAPEELERMPVTRQEQLFDLSLPLLRPVNAPHFPVAIKLFLLHGLME